MFRDSKLVQSVRLNTFFFFRMDKTENQSQAHVRRHPEFDMYEFDFEGMHLYHFHVYQNKKYEHLY